jgi:CheY-specific phosphatase CheX
MAKPVSEFEKILFESLKSGVIETFGSMLGDQPSYLDTVAPESVCDGIVGIISFVGDYSWSLMLGLPRETAIGMSTIFTGMEIPYESDDMGDVAGELANILAGDISARLDANGVVAQLGIPTIIRGSDVRLLAGGKNTSFWRLEFALPDHKFWVRFDIKNQS